jgi:hypothetical protein
MASRPAGCLLTLKSDHKPEPQDQVFTRNRQSRLMVSSPSVRDRPARATPAGWRHDGRMDDRADEPGRQIQVLEVQPGTAHFEQVLILAARVLAQDRYLASSIPHALESHVLAAFDGTRCAGLPALPGPGDRRRGGQARCNAQ